MSDDLYGSLFDDFHKRSGRSQEQKNADKSAEHDMRHNPHFKQMFKTWQQSKQRTEQAAQTAKEMRQANARRQQQEWRANYATQNTTTALKYTPNSFVQAHAALCPQCKGNKYLCNCGA